MVIFKPLKKLINGLLLPTPVSPSMMMGSGKFSTGIAYSLVFSSLIAWMMNGDADIFIPIKYIINNFNRDQ